MQNNNNYCSDLFTGLFLEKEDQNTTRIAHCCVAKLSEPLSTINMDHSHLEKSRQFYLKTGELPDECKYCKDSEKIGSPNQRTARWPLLTEYPIKVQLEKLDYNCDNICNLKCIMCGGHYSSAWLEDELKLGWRNAQDTKIKKTKNNKLFENIDVSHVKQIYFNGGEPLMTRDHINVLNYILKNHHNPSNIKILYSTNATFRFTEEMINIWKNFYEVAFNISIDAIGECFEYTRYGANWLEVEQNLLSYQNSGLDNIVLRIGASIGIHNILYAGELIQWGLDNNYKVYMNQNVWGPLSTLNFPKQHFNTLYSYVTSLPESDVKWAIATLIDSIMKNNETSTSWIDRLNKLDAIRGNNWRKSLSRLYEIDPQYFDQN